jgi:hypothetical protein
VEREAHEVVGERVEPERRVLCAPRHRPGEQAGEGARRRLEADDAREHGEVVEREEPAQRTAVHGERSDQRRGEGGEVTERRAGGAGG